MTTTGKYEKLAHRVGTLVDEKNKAYGNSFDQCGEFLKLLYPDGIPPEKFGDMLCIVRIFDKLKRIATKKGAFSESPYFDLAGYALLGLEKDEREVEADLKFHEQQRDEKLQSCQEKFACQTTETSEKRDALPVNSFGDHTLMTSYEDEAPEKLVPVKCEYCKTTIDQGIPESLVMTGASFGHAECHDKHKSTKL